MELNYGILGLIYLAWREVPAYMERKRAALASQQPKVISLRMDATFFHERAIESLERYHYERALKYFRRAVEFEPDNPVNHCNMAGVLSEIGHYEESNEVLQEIIDRVDPTMTECFFYMANNHANMENFEQAETELIRYLEHDPTGQYLEECEEMMEWLSLELDRPIALEHIKSREGLLEHDRARNLLEKGKFVEAVEQLEAFLKEHPDFLAAYNNLALAYYYMGDLSSCLKMIEKVLDKEPGNLHALCNLAIYHLHSGDEESLEKIRQILTKLKPFSEEYIFKLAMTLAILGEHEAAYLQFRRMIKTMEFVDDPCLFHYTAVASYNTGRVKEAIRWWRSTAKMDPESEIPRFYLNQFEGNDDHQHEVSYHYHLPFEHTIHAYSSDSTGLSEQMKKDPLIRSSFYWALYHGDDQMKQQVIQALAYLGDTEVKSVLHDFLLKKDESSYLINLASFALKSMGEKEPAKNKVLCSKLPEWKPKWEEVVESALKNMDQRFDMIERHDLHTLWLEYLSRVYPSVPSIQKVEGWAAALEYLTAKMHRRETTYAELSRRYRVSVSTIRKNVKLIDEACGLKQKIQHIYAELGHNF